MRELLLVRYGEIFLKGLNRPYFMKALVKKIRHAVKDLNGEVWLHDGRIFVSGFADVDECADRVRRVFGVHSVCPAVEMPKEDFEAICQKAVEMTEGAKSRFRWSPPAYRPPRGSPHGTGPPRCRKRCRCR